MVVHACSVRLAGEPHRSDAVYDVVVPVAERTSSLGLLPNLHMMAVNMH